MLNFCNKDPNAVVLGIKGVHNIEYYMVPLPHIADTLLQTWHIRAGLRSDELRSYYKFLTVPRQY